MTRKEIVKKLGEHLGVTPKYLSVPSFNYQITTADEIYTIDRHGVITNGDGQVVSMEKILNSPPPNAAVVEEEMDGEMPMETEPEAGAIADNGARVESGNNKRMLFPDSPKRGRSPA